MEFLFRHRGAGKRQVKPSQDIALLEDQLGAESSDDSEYKLESDKEHSNESNGEDGDTSSSSDEDEDADASDDEENSKVDNEELAALQKDDHASLSTRELLTLARQELDHNQLPKWVDSLKICGCCLGQASSDANEIVECDGCGVSVHEGCYGINETAGSVASTVSSASTEPWFCEPCRAGLDSSPTCELCPLIGGVYKQTDVGRWVHLVCALYVPGVAFGDPENMTKVTIFEMNYVLWGRRVCSICAANVHESDLSGGVRLSRTGVCIQCDAGLCKAFFHVSCAQAAGLLSEPSYVTNSLHTAEAVMDAYLAHCKVHTDRTVIKRRRRAYLVHLVQSRLRRQANNSKRSLVKQETIETADERILRKLARSQVHYKAERSRGHEPWVPTQKLPRLLATSASAIRKIQRLGEIHDIDKERQVRQEVQVMTIVEAKKKWGVPPAFNLEFVAYYEDREKRIHSLKSQVSQEKKDFEDLRQQESQVTQTFDQGNKTLQESTQHNDKLRSKVESFRSLLSIGGQEVPKTVAKLTLSKIASPETSSVAIRARSTAYSTGLSSQSSSSKHVKVCGICNKSHDQHLLAHCDTCQHHYHLGCLTPPLTRMPKKSKQYGWSCSECYPDSSDDERQKMVFDFDAEVGDENRGRRRRQRRQAASKAMFLTSAEASSGAEEEHMKRAIKESAATANGLDEKKRDDLIAKAAAKAERKRKRKEEKARRKAEKKAKKKLEETVNNGGGGKDSDIEILEDDNGVCVLSIQPKPIKLTIKTNGHATAATSDQPPTHKTPSPTPAVKKTSKDVRTQCDKCQESGDNTNLVRCDECKKCFHFRCLFPPVTKTPKRPGWGWHCNECDPSDRDSDWHLD